MLNGKRIVVVMPAYNAEQTVEQTVAEIPRPVVDHIILVDDHSHDDTVAVAARLEGVEVIEHERNKGYGGNQKTCYRRALACEADVIVMVHPDYQYTPRLCCAIASMVAYGVYDCVLGSRILGTTALRGGMPLYKYVANRLLTMFQNILLGVKLSEYHTGYRAFSRAALEAIPFADNSDEFVFDNQVLLQLVAGGYRIGELSCPTRYAPESSSISFRKSVRYGLGVVGMTLRLLVHRLGWRRSPLFARVNPRPE